MAGANFGPRGARAFVGSVECGAVTWRSHGEVNLSSLALSLSLSIESVRPDHAVLAVPLDVQRCVAGVLWRMASLPPWGL